MMSADDAKGEVLYESLSLVNNLSELAKKADDFATAAHAALPFRSLK